MWAAPFDKQWWDKVPDVTKGMPRFEGATPAAMPMLKDPPTTYWFKTREGGIGVLQIVGQTAKHTGRGPRGIRIRYKMLRRPSPGPTTRPASAPPARR